jgi:hypothetical protein
MLNMAGAVDFPYEFATFINLLLTWWLGFWCLRTVLLSARGRIAMRRYIVARTITSIHRPPQTLFALSSRLMSHEARLASLQCPRLNSGGFDGDGFGGGG